MGYNYFGDGIGVNQIYYLSLAVITSAVGDYRNGKEEVSYFFSGDFKFWCQIAQIDDYHIREALKILQPFEKKKPFNWESLSQSEGIKQNLRRLGEKYVPANGVEEVLSLGILGGVDS